MSEQRQPSAGVPQRAPAAQARSSCRRAGLVKEDQSMGYSHMRSWRPRLPFLTRLTHVLARSPGAQQGCAGSFLQPCFRQHPRQGSRGAPSPSSSAANRPRQLSGIVMSIRLDPFEQSRPEMQATLPLPGRTALARRRRRAGSQYSIDQLLPRSWRHPLHLRSRRSARRSTFYDQLDTFPGYQQEVRTSHSDWPSMPSQKLESVIAPLGILDSCIRTTL